MRRPWIVPALILLALAVVLLSGCAAGATFSAKPQFTVQACLLGAEPIVLGQREVKAWAYGVNDEWLLWGAPCYAAHGKRSAIS